MKTRRSPRNQERLFRYLFKPAEETTANLRTAAEQLDLSTAFWLSPRTKGMIEADRLRAARKAK